MIGYRDKRRRKGGYYDLGPITIPAMPQPIILTDREDGTQYLLSFNTTETTVDNLGRIAINSDVSLQNLEGAKIFDADDGPKFGNDGEYTLIIRGGRIGIEFTAFPVEVIDRDDAPIFGRRRGTRTIRQILFLPTGSLEGLETLAFRTDDFIYG